MKKEIHLVKDVAICVFMITILVMQCNTNKKLNKQTDRTTEQDELIQLNYEVNLKDSIQLLRLQNNALELQRSRERLSKLESKQDSVRGEIQATNARLRILRNAIMTNYADSSYQTLKDRIK